MNRKIHVTWGVSIFAILCLLIFQGFWLNRVIEFKKAEYLNLGEFYQFNLSSCIRQQNSLTAQFVSFSLANLANIFYPPRFLQ